MLSRAASHCQRRIAVRSSLPKVLASKVSPTRFNSFTTTNTGNTSNDNDSIPWYLRPLSSSTLTTPIFKAEMPSLPPKAHPSIEPLVRYMIDNLGLTDFKVFDIRDLDDDLPISSLGDFMIIAQGKSEKHLQNASQDLVTFLKSKHGVVPFVEGLIKPNSMMRLKKRMKKRMLSKKSDKDGEFGIGFNSWIMVDTKVRNVFVHLMTPERRAMMNLEYIWCQPEDRHLYVPKTEIIKGNGREVFDEDSVFSGLQRRHYSTTTATTPSLPDLVLEQLQANTTVLDDASIDQIKKDPFMSLRTLLTINMHLQSLPKSSIDATILATHNDFSRKCFPFSPLREHWNALLDLQYALFILSPNNIPFTYDNHPTYPFRDITNTLKHQVSSGLSLDKAQVQRYFSAVTHLLKPAQPLHGEALEYATDFQVTALLKILDILAINNPESLNDPDIQLSVLKIGTQQHLYEKVPGTYSLAIQSHFSTMLEFFQGISVPSAAMTEFVLLTLLKANNVTEFYKFWDSLPQMDQGQGEVILDSRPWILLLSLLRDEYKENFVEVLVNDKIPLLEAIDGVNDEVRNLLDEILSKYQKN